MGQANASPLSLSERVTLRCTSSLADASIQVLQSFFYDTCSHGRGDFRQTILVRTPVQDERKALTNLQRNEQSRTKTGSKRAQEENDGEPLEIAICPFSCSSSPSTLYAE
jgi:hypothetical protein